MRWVVEPGVRCDLIFYAGANLSGRRATLRVFPAGNKQGTDIGPDDLRSMVIRAPLGTRVVLCRSAGDLWEELPWRCVRLVEGHVVAPERPGGLPGVRIPDLDLFDAPDAKHTSRELMSSYPRADRLADGSGWTFGRSGELKGKVTAIRIEREGRADAPAAAPAQAAFDDLLQRLLDADPALAAAVGPHAAAVLAEHGGDASAWPGQLQP